MLLFVYFEHFLQCGLLTDIIRCLTTMSVENVWTLKYSCLIEVVVKK